MSDKRNPRISSRKQPQQARSSELVASILEAAVQVLASEGAQRFTTARVAGRWVTWSRGDPGDRRGSERAMRQEASKGAGQ